MNQIKVLLVGPTNVGKTVYVRRVNTGEFNKIYDVTNIFEITKINFLTNKGSLDFVIYDFPGNVDIDKEFESIVVDMVSDKLKKFKSIPNAKNLSFYPEF